QCVRLRGKMFLPVPLLHQLLGKGVAIGPAFRIKACAWVAIPIPGATDITASLEHARGHAQFAQAIEHEHARDAGADYDRVELRPGFGLWLIQALDCNIHSVIPVQWNVRPPSTAIAAPVMKEDSLPVRKRITWAISCGSATRFIA